MDFEKTHFKCSVPNTWELIELCREQLGDNDPYLKFVNRPWFTNCGTLYIRRDVVESSPSILTYMALKRVY